MKGLSEPTGVRSILAKGSTALGTVWTLAGALKLIFGIRITFPLFPPLDLERVSAVPSVAIGLVLIFAGAWLQRMTKVQSDPNADAIAPESRTRLLEPGTVGEVGFHRTAPPVSVARRQPNER